MAIKDKKLVGIISQSAPAEKKPLFTPRQVENFKTASAIVLCLAGVAGVIMLSAIAPNAFVAIDKIFFRKRGKKLSKREKDYRVAQVFYYLKSTGQIRMKYTGQDFRILVTKLGRKRLDKLAFQNLQIESPKSWDKKWWQVAADIPTKKHKAGADLFREKLKNMFFFPLQRTLWLHPFDPREEIEFIAKHYGIERFITIMEINRLDRDDETKVTSHFRKLKVI